MTTHWTGRIEEAKQLLDLAKAHQDVPPKALDTLYEALVEITRAIMELEKDDKYRA